MTESTNDHKQYYAVRNQDIIWNANYSHFQVVKIHKSMNEILPIINGQFGGYERSSNNIRFFDYNSLLHLIIDMVNKGWYNTEYDYHDIKTEMDYAMFDIELFDKLKNGLKNERFTTLREQKVSDALSNYKQEIVIYQEINKLPKTDEKKKNVSAEQDLKNIEKEQKLGELIEETERLLKKIQEDNNILNAWYEKIKDKIDKITKTKNKNYNRIIMSS